MPLSFDLSLESLYSYQGRNPKPADFDVYWDSGLAEMRQMDAQVELVPSEFETPFADCFHLYFNGVGGARVHAKLLQPKQPAPGSPAVLFFHGYSRNSGGWVEKLGYPAAGCTVAALDCRGQGGLSEDKGGTQGWTLRGHIVRGLADASPQKLLYRSIFLDTAQLAGIVMDMNHVDEDRVGATGGSQGGGLTMACAALEPRIRRAAPTFPFLADYQRVWEMDLAENAYAELREWFRLFDPQHEKEEEVFTRLGYIDTQHLAKRIEAEVVMNVGLMDQICPPSTQFAVYNKIKAPKSLQIFPDYGHEALPDTPEQIYNFLMGL